MCYPVELFLPKPGDVVYVVVSYIEKESSPGPDPGEAGSNEQIRCRVPQACALGMPA